MFYDKIYFFHSNTVQDSVTIYNQDILKKIKKILNLKKDKTSCVVIINCIYSNYQEIIKILKDNNVQKIYFIIDDFFRVSHKNTDIFCTDSHTIETDFENTIFEELELIKKITYLSEVQDFKVYHCEKIPKKYKKKFDFNIEYFDLYLSNWCLNNQYSKLKNMNFDYKVSCMNHRPDWHRELMAALLHDSPDAFVTTFGKMRNSINPYIKINNFNASFQEEIYKKIKIFKKSPNMFVDGEGNLVKYQLNSSIIGAIQNSKFVLNSINNSFVNIVTETRYASPFQYISEKSIKPVLCYRPFIILGTPYSIALLKKMGLRTFNTWWDESYDSETDHTKRFKMVYDIVTDILKTDTITLQKKLEQMKPILEHNARVVSKIPKFFLNNLNNTFFL